MLIIILNLLLLNKLSHVGGVPLPCPGHLYTGSGADCMYGNWGNSINLEEHVANVHDKEFIPVSSYELSESVSSNLRIHSNIDLCLNVEGTKNLDRLKLRPCDNSNSQKFWIDGNGKLRTGASSNLCVEMDPSSASWGGVFVHSFCLDSWTILNDGSLKNIGDNRCLGINFASDGSTAIRATCDSSAIYRTWSGANYEESLNDYTEFGPCDACSWETGSSLPLSMSDFGNLKHLNIARSGIEGTIPTVIGTLAKLETIIIDHGNLSGTIPDQLQSLSRLQTLSLSSTSLTGTIPLWLSTLEQLKTIHLENNDFTGTIAKEIINLPNLESFLYSGNQNLVTNPCDLEFSCPVYSQCIKTNEIRWGVYDYKCECNLGSVNAANPDTRDVPVEGTCLFGESIELSIVDVESTSFHAIAGLPPSGGSDISFARFRLEKFISKIRKEEIPIYKNVEIAYDSSNKAEITFSNIDPGSKYYLSVVPLKDIGQIHESFTPVIDDQIITTCNCVKSDDGDISGRPRNAKAFQMNGRVTFEFLDNSRCEDAFSFSRHENDSENVFTPDYYYFGNYPCDGIIQPGLQAVDDLSLSQLLVGSKHEYKIRSVARDYSMSDEFSHSSASIAIEHQVLWEASIEGSVTLSKDAGKIPVENVHVEYQLRTSPELNSQVIPSCSPEDVSTNDVGWCTTLTGSGGGYTVDIQSNHTYLNNYDDFPLYLRYYKMSGNISHSFFCGEGERDCTKPNTYAVFLKHLHFENKVEAIDLTTVPFIGTVTVAGTAYGNNLGCPIKNAEVCLEEHNPKNGRETQLACVMTDSTGRYEIPAVLGTIVSPKVNFYEHEFQPTASNDFGHLYSEGIKIQPGVVYEGHTLEDVTQANLMVEVAGGICNRFLGYSTIHISIPGCAWEGYDTFLEGTHKQEFAVAAQLTRVELKKVGDSESNSNNRFNIVASLEEKGQHFYTIDLRQLEEEDAAKSQAGNTPNGTASGQDLSVMPDNNSVEAVAMEEAETDEKEREELKLVRFQYDGEDVVQVHHIHNGYPLNDTCFEPDNSNNALSYHSILTAEYFIVHVKVTQAFGYDIIECDRFPSNTTLTFENYVGEDDKDDKEFVEALSTKEDFSDIVKFLRACKPSCKHPLEYDEDGSNAHFDLVLFAGRPNPFNDHTKYLFITLDRSATMSIAKFVVTGDYKTGDGPSVAIPTHQPLLTLRDPPGGNSYSYYKNVHTTIRVDIENYETYAGFDTAVKAMWGTKLDAGICAGVGVQACKEIIESKFEGGIGVGGGVDFLFKLKDSKSGAEWTTTWSYSTSRDVWLAGKQSDVFLIPNLNVNFNKVYTVYLDDDKCPQAKEDLRFNLDSPENKPAIAFISRFDVESVEIDDLERLRQQEEIKIQSGILNDFDLQAAEASRDAFSQAIDDWRNILHDHDSIAEKAANGELEKMKPNLWFEQVRNEAKEKDDAIYNSLMEEWQQRVDNYNECVGAIVNLADCGSNPVYSKPKYKSINLNKLPETHFSGLASYHLTKNANRIRSLSAASSEDDEGESAVLSKINQIKFDGGGAEIVYELHQHKLSEHASKLGPPQNNARIRGHIDAEISTDIAALFSANIKGNLDVHIDGNYLHRKVDSHADETTIGFVLGDEDSGDVFDVEVYLDPHYGTFVFHTASGRSRCPVEVFTDPREDPEIKIISKRNGLGMPDEPLIFEVQLTNRGSSPSAFQLFTDHRNNPGLVSHLSNGDTLTVPQQYDRILPGESISTIVMLNRGPVGYDFPAIPIIFRSACEFTRNIGDGNLIALGKEGVASSTVNLFNVVDANNNTRIQFAEPCPGIDWASDLLREMSFVFNIETKKNLVPATSDTLQVVARNLGAGHGQKLEHIDRLERVELQYRRLGSISWNKAIGTDGMELNFKDQNEDEFGYISKLWLLDGLGDSLYEIQLKSVCATIPNSPADFNVFMSERIIGVIDRKPPSLFGPPQPMTGELNPGQAVTFQFVENILCEDLAGFKIRVSVDGLHQKFDNVETKNLVTVCKEQFISFQFDIESFDEMSGRNMEISLSDVFDMNGNKMEQTIVHSSLYFSFTDSSLSMYDRVNVACGKNGKCGEPNSLETSKTALHNVRCCSNDEIESWKKKPTCNVWVKTKLIGLCQQDKTYDEAMELCFLVGGRLCTLQELEMNCAASRECSFNSKYVWAHLNSNQKRNLQDDKVQLLPGNKYSESQHYDNMIIKEMNKISTESMTEVRKEMALMQEMNIKLMKEMKEIMSEMSKKVSEMSKKV